MADTKKTEKSLFGQLYDGLTGAIKQAQRGKKERLEKMKCITAHDSAETARDEAEMAIQEHYKLIADEKSLDWEKIAKWDADKDAAEATMKSLEKRYMEVFGEKMNKTI